MQTEFTCGTYTATYNSISGPKWFVKANNCTLALIDEDGLNMRFPLNCKLTQDNLIEISVLMNNIKRQYKQLQTT